MALASAPVRVPASTAPLRLMAPGHTDRPAQPNARTPEPDGPTRQMEPWEYLYFAGDEDGELYQVVAGSIHLEYVTIGGKQLDVLRWPGQFIGDEAFLDRPYEASAIAGPKGAIVRRVPGGSLKSLDYARDVALRLVAAWQSIANCRRPAIDRVKSVLRDLAEHQGQEIDLPQDRIANLAGLSERSVVCRIVARLKAQRIVETGRGCINVLRPDLL